GVGVAGEGRAGQAAGDAHFFFSFFSGLSLGGGGDTRCGFDGGGGGGGGGVMMIGVAISFVLWLELRSHHVYRIEVVAHVVNLPAVVRQDDDENHVHTKHYSARRRRQPHPNTACIERNRGLVG